jgi:hypothetical protein
VRVRAGGQIDTSVSDDRDAFEKSAVTVTGASVFDRFAYDAARIEISVCSSGQGPV